ncbi:MAG: hypothetical protein AB1297_04760, partial [bacterium]
MEKFKKFKEEKMKKNPIWLFLVGLGIFLGIGEKAFAGWGTCTLYIKPGRVMQLQWATETGKTYNVERATQMSPPNWTSVGSDISPGWTDSLDNDGNYWYRIKCVEDNNYSNNSPGGYADSGVPSQIGVFSVTAMPQSSYATLTWTIPGDVNNTVNGGQFYFKLYRKESKDPFTNATISENDLIAVIKAPLNYPAGIFTCLDGTTTGNSIRNPAWQYYSWAKPNSEPERATQYAYAVKVVDTAGVWIVWNDYYPIATDSAVSGNQSSIKEFTNNESMIITPIDDLSAAGVVNQGIRLNWTAETQTLGPGYYFEIYRSTMTATGQGTLTQGSLTSPGPSNPYYIGQTSTLTYLDTTGVEGTHRYSYAVLIVDPHITPERSLLSNDCVIL